MQHAPLGRSVQQNSLGDVARDARLLQVDLGRINVGSNWVCFLNFEKSRSQILKIFQSEDFPLLLRDLYVVLSLQVFTSNNTTIHILTKLFHNLIIKCLTRKFKLCPTQEEITWIAGEISGNSKNPGLRNKKKNIEIILKSLPILLLANISELFVHSKENIPEKYSQLRKYFLETSEIWLRLGYVGKKESEYVLRITSYDTFSPLMLNNSKDVFQDVILEKKNFTREIILFAPSFKIQRDVLLKMSYKFFKKEFLSLVEISHLISKQKSTFTYAEQCLYYGIKSHVVNCAKRKSTQMLKSPKKRTQRHNMICPDLISAKVLEFLILHGTARDVIIEDSENLRNLLAITKFCASFMKNSTKNRISFGSKSMFAHILSQSIVFDTSIQSSIPLIYPTQILYSEKLGRLRLEKNATNVSREIIFMFSFLKSMRRSLKFGRRAEFKLLIDVHHSFTEEYYSCTEERRKTSEVVSMFDSVVFFSEPGTTNQILNGHILKDVLNLCTAQRIIFGQVLANRILHGSHKYNGWENWDFAWFRHVMASVTFVRVLDFELDKPTHAWQDDHWQNIGEVRYYGQQIRCINLTRITNICKSAKGIILRNVKYHKPITLLRHNDTPIVATRDIKIFKTDKK